MIFLIYLLLIMIFGGLACAPPPVYRKSPNINNVIKNNGINRVAATHIEELEQLYEEQSGKVEVLEEKLNEMTGRVKEYQEHEKLLLEKLFEVKAELHIERQVKEKMWKNLSYSLNYKNKTNQAMKYLLLAEEQYFQEDFKAAYKFCEKAIVFNPSLSICHERMGSILLKLNNRDGAVESWEKALEIDPENSKLYEWLSKIRLSED